MIDITRRYRSAHVEVVDYDYGNIKYRIKTDHSNGNEVHIYFCKESGMRGRIRFFATEVSFNYAVDGRVTYGRRIARIRDMLVEQNALAQDRARTAFSATHQMLEILVHHHDHAL